MELCDLYEAMRKGVFKHGDEGWFYAIGFYDKRKYPPKAPMGGGILWIDGDSGMYLKNEKGTWRSVKIQEDAINTIKNVLEKVAPDWKRNQFYDISYGGRLFFHILEGGTVQISRKKW